MNLTRMFFATAVATSVLAAIGCNTPQKAPEVATAPVTVPAAAPEPVAAADAMPSHPALQNERTAEAPVVNEPPPVVAAKEPVMTPPADFTERAPRADRN